MTGLFDRPRWAKMTLGSGVLFLVLGGVGGIGGIGGGCTQHTVKVEPIQVNMNVRADIYLHVDKELDEYFDDSASPAPASGEKSSVQPATR